jgi:nicotinamide-nucleotide amidase
LAFRAHFPDLTLRLTMSGGAAQAENIHGIARPNQNILGDYLYADREATLEGCRWRLLLQKQLTLALAESCTGGLISHRITEESPGARRIFLARRNLFQRRENPLAGGQSKTLARAGAVSGETALEMSQGIRQRTVRISD